MDKKTLDHLKYGDPSNRDKKRMARETPLIGISFDQVNISPPSLNSSNETFSELKLVIKSIKDSNKDERFIKIADERPIAIFQSFANENGLLFDEKYFKQLKKELSSLILSLKYKFNRPRPRQLARSLGVKLDMLDFDTAKTPAYPSGHAIQSHVIANIMSRMNPRFKKSLEMLADRISLSRMQAGVHYPSDLFIGKEIAHMIDPHIVTMYKTKSLALEDFRITTREFLREMSREELTQKLRILDFDDTIASTAERVIITTDEGRGRKFISSADFAVYDLQPGESIDPEVAFEEFSSVDIESAEPTPLVSDLLKRFAGPAGTSKLLILTARDQSVEPFVIDFLEKRLGIENARNRVDFVGVGSKDPSAKVAVVQDYLDSNPDINFVSFYDDSGKNVRAVNDFLDQRGFSRERDQRDIRQVVHTPDGGVRLVSPDDDINLDESLDFRTITRRFLKGIVS